LKFDTVAGRDFLAAISLANLSFLHVWSEFLTYTKEQSSFLERPPLGVQFAAAITDVVLLGIVLFGVIRLTRRIGNRYGTAWTVPIVLLLALLPANAARSSFAVYFPLLRSGLLASVGVNGTILVYACLSLSVAFLLFRLKTRVAGLAMLALLEFVPLVAVEAAAAIWHLRRENPQAYLNGPLAPVYAAKPGDSRVVWIIFDELDYRLLFAERPATVDAPEFDRLRSESVFATNAHSPTDTTLTSIPSLLTGHQISTISLSGPGALTVGWAGASEPQRMNRTPTIFSVARNLGRNTAVAGWYLPYCRVFNADLNRCFWGSAGDLIDSTGRTFPENAVNQGRSLFETSLFSPFGQSLLVKDRIRMQDELRREALRDATDSSLGLVFLHYPVPHSPYTYDRFRRAFTKRNAAFDGYLDSLALADLILGEIREGMTAAGVWNTTTLLVSADHWFRSSRQLDGKQDNRVPFLLRFPGQMVAVEYHEPLYTLVSKALLESVLRGEVHTPHEALNWLRSHSASR
jgi:hypothetical protein